MNRHFIIYILVTLVLIGCSEKYEENLCLYPTLTPRYLTITPTSLTYTSSPSTKYVSITSTLTPWKIENGIDWVSTSLTSGNASSIVSVGVTENKSGDDARVGIFYLKSDVNDWRYEAPISVTQSGATPIITLSKSTIELSGASNTESVLVSANCTWSVSSAVDWLTVAKKDNTIILSTTSNETDSYRSTTVSIVHEGTSRMSRFITVKQAPASINASVEALEFNNTAGRAEITITSEANWIASTSSSWIDISPSSGYAGTSILKVNVSPNTSTDERTDYIILSIGANKKIQIPVKQRGIYIEVDKTDITYAASGESKTFTINSNTSWIIKNTPSWLTVSQASGNGNATVTITASNNASSCSRSATICVTQEGVTIGASINITQNGKSLEVSTQSLNFEDVAGTKNIEIRSDELWVIQNDNLWIVASPSSGSGTTSVELSVSENETEASREGYIYVTMLDKTVSVKVTQEAKVFSAETDNVNITFPASGGKSSFNVTSNTNWTITNCPTWISLSKSNGKGNANIEIIAQDNPNTAERYGEMFLQINGKDEKTAITIKQYGKSFSLTPSSLTFSDKSDSQTVTIETDGSWNASTSSSWISLSPVSDSGNATLTVSVSENTTNTERNGTIQVTMSDKSLYISVNQKGKYLTITNSLLTYTSKGGSIGITVTTNDSWTARTEGNASWLSVSKSLGSGTADIKVTASDNASVNSRTGYVVIETPHGLNVRIMVTQDARYLTTNHSSLLFYSKGGTSEAITVSTDGTYSISCSDSWLTVNQSSNTFTVTASENTTTEARIGYITIYLTDLIEGTYSLKLAVTQLNYGGSFLRNDYGDDTNYDETGTTTGSLIITGFGTEKNYDTSTASGTTLSVSNYKSDSIWDTTVSTNVTVTITGYKSDDNLDSQTNTSGTISKTGFEGDSNWQ